MMNGATSLLVLNVLNVFLTIQCKIPSATDDDTDYCLNPEILNRGQTEELADQYRKFHIHQANYTVCVPMKG